MAYSFVMHPDWEISGINGENIYDMLTVLARNVTNVQNDEFWGKIPHFHPLESVKIIIVGTEEGAAIFAMRFSNDILATREVRYINGRVLKLLDDA